MKRQKWLTGILAVILVASFLLAVVSFVVPSPVAAAGGDDGVEPDSVCGLCMLRTQCCNCRPTICGSTPPNYYLYRLYECYTDEPECEQYWEDWCIYNHPDCTP